MFTFPKTPYIYSETVRDDKVLNKEERNAFLSNVITIEEKVDGYNLGISFDDEGELLLQHRGAYVDDPKIHEWIKPKTDDLFDNLMNRYILFGEWCYYKHSIHYTELPNFFLGFDIYDTLLDKFYCITDRNYFLNKINIHPIPLIDIGIFTLENLQKYLITPSHFGPIKEGLYLRLDGEDFIEDRSKIVNSNFTQNIDIHWTKEPVIRNKILYK